MDMQTEPKGSEVRGVPEKLNSADIITVTARLAQVLAEEVDLLGQMKMGQIADLQKEKLFLTNTLEAYRKMVLKHPHLIETIPSQDRDDLRGVVQVFEDILAENHRRLQIAREVNMRVVQAVTEVVRDSSMSSVYDSGGVRGQMGGATISVTLNQTA